MSRTKVSPGQCRTMAEVRHGVDRLDEQILALLAERFRYMDAAARIKPVREAVRDEARKAEVLANVRRLADSHAVPADVVQDVYERLVEGSIDYEFVQFDAGRS